MLWAVCIRCCYTKQCMDLLEESRSFISSNSCKTKRTIIIILLLVHVQRNVEPLAWHVKSLFEKKKRLAYYMKQMEAYFKKVQLKYSNQFDNNSRHCTSYHFFLVVYTPAYSCPNSTNIDMSNPLWDHNRDYSYIVCRPCRQHYSHTFQRTLNSCCPTIEMTCMCLYINIYFILKFFRIKDKRGLFVLWRKIRIVLMFYKLI